jgi:hypothetical protein
VLGRFILGHWMWAGPFPGSSPDLHRYVFLDLLGRSGLVLGRGRFIVRFVPEIVQLCRSASIILL